MEIKDAIIQPEEFRKDPRIPEWVYLQPLRTLLGWGDGLWETLGDKLIGLRGVYVMARDGKSYGPVAAALDTLMSWVHAQRERQGQRLPLVIELIGLESCFRTAQDMPSGWRRYNNCECSPHDLDLNADFRLWHTRNGDDWSLTVRRRRKRLKPEFIRKMEELGLKHEPGVGKISAGPRTPAEQAFAAYVTDVKAKFIAERSAALLVNPSSRPPHFDEVRGKLLRTREGEIQRGKNGSDGLPKRPYAEKELTERTCRTIADREAVDLTFEYAYEPFIALRPGGIVT